MSRGVRVLAETPPAPDARGCAPFGTGSGSGLVAVAEQYLLMPGHFARKAIVDAGVIGVPTFVEVASTHLYHAISMMRGLLGAGFDPVRVDAHAFEDPLAHPFSPSGWDAAAEPRPTRTTIAILHFGKGRSGLYQFVDDQWWNPLLSRRILVRSPLSYRRLGVDLDLAGNELDSISFDGRILHRNAWRGCRFSEDDLAVADLLAATGAWARGEAGVPYSLADACQDHLLGLAIEESARTGREVVTEIETWATGV